MEPAPDKQLCGSCGSITHQRRSSLQCPFNSKWDSDDAKRAELAAVVALQRRDAGIDEEEDDVLDLDGPAGTTAGLGDNAVNAIGSPEYAKARRVERLARAARRGSDAAMVTTSPTREQDGEPVGEPTTTVSPQAFSPVRSGASSRTPSPSGQTTGTATSTVPAATTSTPLPTSRPPSPQAQLMATLQAMMTMMMNQTQAITAIAQGLRAPTSQPGSPQISATRIAHAKFDATNSIAHVAGSGDTSFTATPQVKDRKPTRLSNTSNIPSAPTHTAGLKKWRRDFCRYLDANVSGIGPLVCPDLYGATTAETFDRTAMACAVEAIRIATTDTDAADVLDDIDDEDVDPATLMELVIDYIVERDSDSSLVLERALESIAPTATGTRVEQIGKVYKDIKAMERRYKANGMVRGPDYFVTRARLLVAQHYPGLTFSSDRSFQALNTLFKEYHHRAADADELERRNTMGGGTSGNAFPATSTGGNTGMETRARVPSVAFKLEPGELLPMVGPHWCDVCKQNVKHTKHAPWCGKCKRHHPGECRNGNDKTNYKKSYATVSVKLNEQDVALAAMQDRVDSAQASQAELQARIDTSQVLIAKYQAAGFQQELPGGPP
jgi:hypothetical protein